jgi:YD repeat-containing protein
VTVTTYNVYDQRQTATTTVGSSTRTATTSYDAAGRTVESKITSSVGKPLPAVRDEYDSKTGVLTRQSTTSEGTTSTITSHINTLGQVTSYTDAAGNTSTSAYDIDGRITEASDGKGTQSYSYDPTTGLVTGLKDSAAGAFSATYNAEGQLATQTYPNGMTATSVYDATGQVISLTYTKGSATWYADTVIPSIHGQWMTQTSTLQSDSYSYDNLGRMTEVQETPQGKTCTSTLLAYDEDSNRTSQTKRESTEAKCATTGGVTESHIYDEANRLADPGVQYDPFGANKVLPGADAGGQPLESSYYAGGALYSQTQGTKTNTYVLDSAGRVRETTAQIELTAKTTISHYSGSGSTPAWTEEKGGVGFSRNIAGIGGSLCATQTNTGEPAIQIANLHGDVIGTVPDNQTAEKPTLTSEPTGFGVPTSTSSSKYSWLGAGGLATEFESGIASSSGGSYVPQLGIHLAPAGLSAAASQDPVNEYLANRTLAQPTGNLTMTLPGAIEPTPVNTQMQQEFFEHPPWDNPPPNQPEGEEEGEEEEETAGGGGRAVAHAAGAATTIVCGGAPQYPHKSTHAGRKGKNRVNVVFVAACSANVVTLRARVALYRGHTLVAESGYVYSRGQWSVEAIANAPCVSGLYQAWVNISATPPPGAILVIDNGSSWGTPTYVRC